jgi:PAS domain S-box-containing protein
MKADQRKRPPRGEARGQPGCDRQALPGICLGDAIEGARRRLAALQQAPHDPHDSEDLLANAFQELQITFEELQVADEELRQQNEELIVARQMAEVERQRYQELFDFAPDPYLVTDANALIQEANRAAAALLGVPRHHLRGKPLILFVAAADGQAFLNRLLHLSEHGDRLTWEARLQPRRGDPLYAAMTVAVVRTAQSTPVALRWLIRDITAHKAAEEKARQAEQALRASQEQLRALATHLQERQEEERRRIAREIHDELAQALTVLKMDVAWLGNRLAKADASCRRRLRDMRALLDGLVQSVRRIGTDLRPDILDDLGLTAAIEWQLQEVSKRTGLAHELTLPAQDIALEQALATAIFRIFQEALTNVLRHAGASKVTVRVMLQPEGLILEIADDGKGITPAQLADRKALGLLSMRERAHLWGGDLTICGRPGQGTTVTLRMPYRASQAVGALS